MKLLIVVSKLLTGFDAPSCTYIYLDNELRDHNLFQAICRTNRLDGDDKDYGHIVDFKELFGDVQEAIAVYSSDELDIDEGSGGDNNVHLKDWLDEGKKQLDEAREALRYLCEPVPPAARGGAVPALLLRRRRQPERAERDRGAAGLVLQGRRRLRARLSPPSRRTSTKPGTPTPKRPRLQKEVEFYSDIRSAIKKHSGEELDIKPYEADMRHLLNTYIQADPAADLGELGEMSLTELIIETGIHDAIARKLNEKGKLSRNAIAEGIINNVRKTIIRDQLTDPRFYEEMSKLLDDLIKQSRDRRRRVRGVPAEGRGAGEAAGREAARRRRARGAARQAGGDRDLQQPAADPRGRRSCCPVRTTTEKAASVGAGDRPGHARAGPGRLEGRPGARGAGAERAVPAAQPRPRGDARAVRARQEPAGVLMAETIQLGDIVIARDAQGHQARPPVRASAGRTRHACRADGRRRLEVARAYAISKLGWIRQQRERLRGQARETPRQFVERESHYPLGATPSSSVSEKDAKPAVRLDHRTIHLQVRPGTSRGRA